MSWPALHRAFGGRELADDDLEQRGFAQAVPPGDADAPAVLEREIEPAKQRAPAEVHAEVAQLDDAIAQLRRRRNAKLHVFLDHRPVLRGGFVVTLEAVLLFAALRARPLPHPGQFLFQKHLALVLDGGVGGLALGLVQQVIGVIAGMREKPAIGQLNHAFRHAVEEIAVVRDDEEGTVEFVEKFRDPLDGFRVQMVRRLVENQQVGVRDHGAAHGHAPFLAAGKRLNAPVAGGTIQVRHRRLNAPVQRPAFQRGDAMLQFLVAFRVVRQRFKFRDQIEHVLRAVADVFEHILRRIEHEILRQVADDQFAPPGDIAAVGRLQPGEDAKERRLAAAVAPDQPDAVALVDGERRGVEHRAVAVAHGDFSGGEDGGHGGTLNR